MRKFLPIILLVFLVFLASWAVIQFTPIQQDTIDVSKTQIYSSIVPIADLVEKLGGDFVQSYALVPAGASVHTYEPTPSQLRAIDSADLYVKVGTPIEFEVTWLDKLLAINPQLSVIDLSTGIDLIESSEQEEEHVEEDHEHEHEGGDPHIWLSPKNILQMIPTITNALIEKMPEHESYFLVQQRDLLLRLTKIDNEVEATLNSFPQREIIVYHDAWAYFARDYELNLIVVEENRKEPTAKRIQSVITLAKENEISTIFASPEFNTQSAETIAKEAGAEVLFISPLPEDLLNAFDQISQAFAQALKK